MIQPTAAEKPRGKFKKIRELNRRRNYFIKKMRTLLRVYIAKTLWDRPARNELNLDSAKTVLLLRNEGALGDVVVDSALVKCLHESGYSVDFLLTKSNSQVMRYNPRIRNIYEAENTTSVSYMKKFTHNVPHDVVAQLANNKYDIVIDPSLFDIPVHRMQLLRQINAKAVLGFNKHTFIKHYTKSFDFDCLNWHVSKTFSCIADCMKLDKSHLTTYDLHIPQDIYAETQQYLAAIDGRKVIINIFAGNDVRSLSQAQLAALIEQMQQAFPTVNIILLDHRQEIQLPLPERVTVNPFKTLHHTMALIAQADLVISPDTSIVHMSAAWQKPLIAIYRDSRVNNQLWAPGYDKARQLIIKCEKVQHKHDLASLIMAEIDPTLLQ